MNLTNIPNDAIYTVLKHLTPFDMEIFGETCMKYKAITEDALTIFNNRKKCNEIYKIGGRTITINPDIMEITTPGNLSILIRFVNGEIYGMEDPAVNIVYTSPEKTINYRLYSASTDSMISFYCRTEVNGEETSYAMYGNWFISYPGSLMSKCWYVTIPTKYNVHDSKTIQPLIDTLMKFKTNWCGEIPEFVVPPITSSVDHTGQF